MPPQRTPLHTIDGNRKGRGPELSPYIRGKIVGLVKARESLAEIQAILGLSRGVVRGTITQDHARPGLSAPCSKRPCLYIDREERMMLRHLRLYPKSTFKER